MRPEVGTPFSAGYDLKLASDIIVPAGGAVKVGTGVKVEIPRNFAGFIIPRSSTGNKGLALLNTVGVIDSDYQGEIFLPIHNKGRETFLGYRGDKLFQLVIVPILVCNVEYVDSFDSKTERGEDGFGSTDGT